MRHALPCKVIHLHKDYAELYHPFERRSRRVTVWNTKDSNSTVEENARFHIMRTTDYRRMHPYDRERHLKILKDMVDRNDPKNFPEVCNVY